MKRAALLLALGSAAIYAGDAGYSALRPRFDSVRVERFYTVHEKFNKVSYVPNGVADVRCIRALFPHAGSNPCWYVTRHRLQFEDLN